MFARSQRFIRDYRRVLDSSGEFFNVDTNLMSRDLYDTASVRVLIVFPSPVSAKAYSMTAAVINDYVIAHCPNVFVDVA